MDARWTRSRSRISTAWTLWRSSWLRLDYRSGLKRNDSFLQRRQLLVELVHLLFESHQSRLVVNAWAVLDDDVRLAEVSLSRFTNPLAELSRFERGVQRAVVDFEELSSVNLAALASELLKRLNQPVIVGVVGHRLGTHWLPCERLRSRSSVITDLCSGQHDVGVSVTNVMAFAPCCNRS